MTMTSRRLSVAVVAIAGLLLALVATSAQASPSETGCDNRSFGSVQSLLECIDVEDARAHQAAWQAIADANGGTRVSGTNGYDESVDYVAELLDEAGFDVTIQEFDFFSYIELSSELLIDGVVQDSDTMAYSGSGSVTDGNVVAVDLDLGLGNSSTSGCEASDFDGLDFSGPNDIAVMQRGACAFFTKAFNAQAAGAEGALIFNQGNTEERQGRLQGTLGAGASGVITIPVLDSDYFTGVAAIEASSVSLSAETLSGDTTTENVIAELPGRNADNVVMAGAHLDSVSAGPGIQDNGTGSAAILTTALALGNADYTPTNTLRFAWWGAEESGLLGSEYYVQNLTDEERDEIALYLNFDMIGSPNHFFGVYDADESSFEAPVVVPEGSEAIEDVFEAFYTSRGVPYDDSAFSGRSDYQEFINFGIPAGGLFTGAEVLKTEEQAAIWGGTVGEQFDPCYHLACDTFDNINLEAFATNVDAVADAVFRFAGSTEAVNGVKGRSVGPTVKTFDGPRFTFVDEVAGGLDLDHDHDHSLGEPS